MFAFKEKTLENLWKVENMSEIYEALTNIGIAFLMIIFFMYNGNLATKYDVRPWKIIGFLFTPVVQFLLIGYFIYKNKVEKERQMFEDC